MNASRALIIVFLIACLAWPCRLLAQEDNQAKIDRLFQEADRHKADRDFMVSERGGRTEANCYEDILALDPANKLALDGLKAIEQYYLGQNKQSIAAQVATIIDKYEKNAPPETPPAPPPPTPEPPPEANNTVKTNTPAIPSSDVGDKKETLPPTGVPQKPPGAGTDHTKPQPLFLDDVTKDIRNIPLKDRTAARLRDLLNKYQDSLRGNPGSAEDAAAIALLQAEILRKEEAPAAPVSSPQDSVQIEQLWRAIDAVKQQPQGDRSLGIALLGLLVALVAGAAAVAIWVKLYKFMESQEVQYTNIGDAIGYARQVAESANSRSANLAGKIQHPESGKNTEENEKFQKWTVNSVKTLDTEMQSMRGQVIELRSSLSAGVANVKSEVRIEQSRAANKLQEDIVTLRGNIEESVKRQLDPVLRFLAEEIRNEVELSLHEGRAWIAQQVIPGDASQKALDTACSLDLLLKSLKDLTASTPGFEGIAASLAQFEASLDREDRKAFFRCARTSASLRELESLGSEVLKPGAAIDLGSKDVLRLREQARLVRQAITGEGVAKHLDPCEIWNGLEGELLDALRDVMVASYEKKLSLAVESKVRLQLRRIGIEPMSITLKSTRVKPSLHDPVMSRPASPGAAAGAIVQVIEPGYLRADTRDVIRKARVVTNTHG